MCGESVSKRVTHNRVVLKGTTVFCNSSSMEAGPATDVMRSEIQMSLV